VKFPVLDLETTGLEIEGGEILDVSLIICDENFRSLETYSSAVKQNRYSLDGKLNDWAFKQHTKSGLLQDCMGPHSKTLHRIELDVIGILERHFSDPKEKPMLCGNSIHWDRNWIKAYMQDLDKKLHYRMIDVSGMWQSLRLLYGVSLEKGEPTHRALDDAKKSIEYLEKYTMFLDQNRIKRFCLNVA
jgi:oligoribonuclease